MTNYSGIECNLTPDGAAFFEILSRFYPELRDEGSSYFDGKPEYIPLINLCGEAYQRGVLELGEGIEQYIDLNYRNNDEMINTANYRYAMAIDAAMQYIDEQGVFYPAQFIEAAKNGVREVLDKLREECDVKLFDLDIGFRTKLKTLQGGVRCPQTDVPQLPRLEVLLTFSREQLN